MARNKFWERLKRPSLLWLSRKEVTDVRNAVLTTFLDRDECLKVLPTKGHFGIREVKIYGSVSPCFEWEVHDELGAFHFEAWLRVYTDDNPLWHVKINGDEAIVLGFKDKRVRVASEIVRAFSVYYPFCPTQNFLQKRGEFIA